MDTAIITIHRCSKYFNATQSITVGTKLLEATEARMIKNELMQVQQMIQQCYQNELLCKHVFNSSKK